MCLWLRKVIFILTIECFQYSKNNIDCMGIENFIIIIIIVVVVLHAIFFMPTSASDLCWCLSDSKPPYVPRTLLSILSDFNNAVVCIVYIFL